MSRDSHTFIYLPGGGGGGEHDLAAFASGLDHELRFETINYPGWQRYVQDDFSAETLIAELTSEVVRKVPAGPIRLMGLSIGGHFGYAVALRLQEMRREVAVFCVIDSFMIASAQPSAGWKSRALADALDLLRKRRFGDLLRFVRSKAWRALLRLAGGRLTGPLRRFAANGQLPSMLKGDAIAEQELSMRLLIRTVAPWIADLDRHPVPLHAPTILLRTQGSACHDAVWRKRCPNIAVREVPGKHLTLFEPENIQGLREAFSAAANQIAA